jgi:hypothetical protein
MDANLASFATDRQQQYWEAVEEHGGVVAAAKALGVKNHSVITRAIQAVKAKAGVSEPKASLDPVGKRIMVIPDVQAKPGVDFSYLTRIGMYAVEKKPDIIVCGGDFADMPSLSSYDKGKKSFEGRRYKRDVEAAHWAMSALMTPIVDYNAKAKKPYKPRLVLTLGNHEERILRAINEDPKLDGVLSIDDLKYKDFGWEVYPFLEVVMVEGIAFSHYFTTGTMGRPATTAAAVLSKKHQSCIAFHQQGLQIATGYRADGALLTSVITGSCYEHDESYLGPQGNNHWRGFLMCHDTVDGVFDLMTVSLKYINRRYPHVKAPEPVYSVPTAQELQAGRM